jgi:hypothetical protein
MKIKWNEVTRLSQIIALILFVAVYFLGMYVGIQIEKNKIVRHESGRVETSNGVVIP